MNKKKIKNERDTQTIRQLTEKRDPGKIKGPISRRRAAYIYRLDTQEVPRSGDAGEPPRLYVYLFPLFLPLCPFRGRRTTTTTTTTFVTRE